MNCNIPARNVVITIPKMRIGEPVNCLTDAGLEPLYRRINLRGAASMLLALPKQKNNSRLFFIKATYPQTMFKTIYLCDCNVICLFVPCHLFRIKTTFAKDIGLAPKK